MKLHSRRQFFEREKQYASGSSDDESPRAIPKQSPRGSYDPSGRKSPRSSINVKTSPRTLSSRSLKKVSSFDKLGAGFWRVHARSNRGAISTKEQTLIGETVSLNYLSIHDWKVLCTGAQMITLRKDAYVIKEGDYNTALYRIKSGSVRIEKRAQQNGTECSVLLTKLEKNKVFGEMSFVEDDWKPGTKEEEGLGGNVSASVIVDSDTIELYKIERLFIFSLFIADRDLFARFYQIIASMLADRILNLPLRDKLKNPGSLTPSPRSSPRPSELEQSPSKIEKKEIFIREVQSPRTTSSPSRDFKGEKIKKKSDSKFIKRFRLPPDEYLIKAYKCSMAKHQKGKSRTFHGRLFIGSNYVCFYSRIFGYIYKKIINFRDITKLKLITDENGREKIKIKTGEKKNTFFMHLRKNQKLLKHIKSSRIYMKQRAKKSQN